MTSLVTLHLSFNTSDSSLQTAPSLIPQALHKWTRQEYPGAHTQMSREDAGTRVRDSSHPGFRPGQRRNATRLPPPARIPGEAGPRQQQQQQQPFAGPGCPHGRWRGRQLALTPPRSLGHAGASGQLTGRELEQEGLGVGAGSVLQAAPHGARQLRTGDEAAGHEAAPLLLTHRPLLVRRLRYSQGRVLPPRRHPARRQPAEQRLQPPCQEAAAARGAQRGPARQHRRAALPPPGTWSPRQPGRHFLLCPASQRASAPPSEGSPPAARPLYGARPAPPAACGSTSPRASTPCRLAGPGRPSRRGAEVSWQRLIRRGKRRRRGRWDASPGAALRRRLLVSAATGLSRGGLGPPGGRREGAGAGRAGRAARLGRGGQVLVSVPRPLSPARCPWSRAQTGLRREAARAGGQRSAGRRGAMCAPCVGEVPGATYLVWGLPGCFAGVFDLRVCS